MFVERLNDDGETVERFCYLGNALQASGDSEKMTVVTRTTIGWMRLREGEKFCMKGFVKDERESVSDLCKTGNTVWKQNMVLLKTERTKRALAE